MLRVHFSEVLHLARAHTHKHTHKQTVLQTLEKEGNGKICEASRTGKAPRSVHVQSSGRVARAVPLCV
jgi:hypothetical protein